MMGWPVPKLMVEKLISSLHICKLTIKVFFIIFLKSCKGYIVILSCLFYMHVWSLFWVKSRSCRFSPFSLWKLSGKGPNWSNSEVWLHFLKTAYCCIVYRLSSLLILNLMIFGKFIYIISTILEHFCHTGKMPCAHFQLLSIPPQATSDLLFLWIHIFWMFAINGIIII